MTKQKFIAGYDLDKVYEEEEARLKAEREAAERARLKDELRQRQDARKPKAKPPVVTPPVVVASTGITPYRGIEFEYPAYREAGETNKALLPYDASLARLRAAGFERHARPQEVFGLLADGLEGKLTLPEKAIYDDQRTGEGEWLSAAMERTSGKLTVYLDPEGLIWDGGKYVKQNFRSGAQKEFSVQGISSLEWIDLNLFSPDFVTWMYTRPFNQLPQQLQKGDERAQVCLPPADGQMWPVGRSDFNDGYNVYGVNFNFGASRGVRGRASAPKK